MSQQDAVYKKLTLIITILAESERMGATSLANPHDMNTEGAAFVGDKVDIRAKKITTTEEDVISPRKGQSPQEA